MSDGKEELILIGLDKLDDPPSLTRLREAVKSRLPRVDLLDILLEIAARAGFTSKFTHEPSAVREPAILLPASVRC